MKFKIRYSKKASDYMNSLPKKEAKQLINKITSDLEERPFPHQNSKVKRLISHKKK